MFALTTLNLKQKNSNLKIAAVDLVIMAMFAGLGLATKNILRPSSDH